jgi:predicted TIM-barrel fold metal-dependent hydrolase
MIIDVHAHIGEDVVFDEALTEQELIEAYERHHIDGGIVQPYLPRIYMEAHREIHDRIFQLTKSEEKRFWGMASINPHFTPEDYDQEAKRCIEALGFVGIKITPIGHATHPSSKDALHVGLSRSRHPADDPYRRRGALFRSHQRGKRLVQFPGCGLRSGPRRIGDAQSAGDLSGQKI